MLLIRFVRDITPIPTARFTPLDGPLFTEAPPIKIFSNRLYRWHSGFLTGRCPL